MVSIDLETGRDRPTFPDTCIAPDQPGFGQIISGDVRRRRSRRVAGPASGSSHSWSIMSPIDQSLPPRVHLPPLQEKFYVGNPQNLTHPPFTPQELPLPRSPNPPTPTSQPDSPRYDPYQSSYLSQRPEIHVSRPSDQPYPRRPASTSPMISEAQRVTLPPARPSSSNHAVSLPSVADLVSFNATGDRDPPKTILERLKHGDSSVHHTPTTLAALLGSSIFVANRFGCIGPDPRTRLLCRGILHHDLRPSWPFLVEAFPLPLRDL